MNDETFGTIDGYQITLYDQPVAPADTRTDEQKSLDAFSLNRALHVNPDAANDDDVIGAAALLKSDFAKRAKLGAVQTDLLLGKGAEKDPRAVLRKMQDFYRSGDVRNLWTDERREAEDAAARGVDALYALASKKAHTAWWRNIGDPLDRAADEAMRRAGRDRPIDADKFEALMGSGDPELDEETAQSLRGAQSILSRRRDLQKAADDAAARRAGSDDYIAAGQALSDFEREHADELAAASALVGKWHGKADKALTGAQYLAGLRAAQPDLMAAAVLSSGVLKSPVSAAILQNARDSRPGRGGVAESLDLSFSASDKAEWFSLPKEDREIITPILQAYVNPRDLGRVPVFGAIYEGFLEAGKAETNIGFQVAHTAESLLRRTVMDGADVQKWEEDWAELQEMRETATKKSENHWLPTDWAIGAMSQAPYMFGASLPRVGIALITAQAATDYISQVAREGGDVSSMDTVAEALGIGLATGISEKIEVDIFKGARKMTPLERIRVYDCLKRSSIVWRILGDTGRILGDTAGELTQEALQDALMGASVAAKVDRDWVPAMAQGAWEAIREGYGDFLVLGTSGVITQNVAQRHGAINGAQAERISEFIAPVVKDLLTAKAAGQLAPLPDMEAWKANMGDISDKFRKAGGMRGGGVKFLEDLGFKHDAALSIGYAIESTYRAVLRTGSGKTISDFFGGRGMRTWKDIFSDFFGGAEVTPDGENAYTVRRTITNGSRSVDTETRVELGKVETDYSIIEQRDEAGAPTSQAQSLAASVVQGVKAQDPSSAMTEADVLAMTGDELRQFLDAKELANPGSFRLTSGGAAVDSEQLAALTGTIRFDPTLDPEAFLHEAGHAFLAYAEKAGILSDADFDALRSMFGDARTSDERINEEAFSDALRDAMAGRIRWTDQTLFERIRDAIVRLLDMGAELLHLRRAKKSAADAARDSVFEQVLSGNVRGIPMVAASQSEKASPSGAATATPSETPPSAPPAPEPNPSENPTGSENPDNSKPPARPRRAPTEWTAVTPDGSMRLSGDWVVVDASTLLASSDPGYDQALQPRDRSTLASDSQVHAIATELDPARLADSPTTDTGAPLVSADGMVLSGNGRTLAIRAAYASGLAGAYAEAVRARASEMGLAVPDSMRAPVLVRRLSAETSREDLVRAAELSNRPQILSRNESETAEADAATLLSGGFLDLLQPGDNGELLGEANRAFMDAFIDATGDQGLRTADGFPTEAAQKRVRRAVLAALFQDLPNRRDLIRAAVEDADELHVTRELAGLMRGAPAILRAAAARPAYDLRGEIGIALADYFDFRRQGGGDINAYLAQGQLFDERPPEVSAVLREIGERQNATAISDFLQDYARRAEAQAAEGQDTFAFFAPPTKLDLLAAASEATLPEGTSRSPAEYVPPPYRRGTAVLPGPDAKPVAASQVDAQGRPTTKVRMLPPGAWSLLRAPYDVRRAPAPSAQDKAGRGLGISDPPPTGHSDIFPHFQGNKTEMAARTTQAIRRTMSDAERAHYDTIVDYFGGGGCWGLYHALENFPGVRRLVVNEFDPDRLGKIRLLHEHDGKVADTAGAFLLDDVRLGQIREAAQNSSSPTTIASKVQSILLPTVKDANMRAALQAFIDCAHTMLASATDEKGNVVRDASVGVGKVLDALREDGRKAKAAADEFKARGGTIEYHAGDAATFDDAPRGDRVMAVADPPYYLTADYQQNTILGLDIVPDNWSYRATQGLLHKLSEAGDGIIYTDEAWWFKDSYVPDRQDSLFGGGSTFDKEQDILLDVINTLDHFDVAGRVAGRQEVLGIHHGHAIDQETESGTGGDAARPDAADHSGGGQGARPPVLGMAAEPQGQGGRNGATGGERGPDGAGSGAVATRLSVSGIPTPAELAEAARQYDEVVARYTNPDGTRKPGWKKAPNGADTHLTERQWVQVRTENFKAWFGDWENDPANASKVVDENGEPRVVWHGSPNRFWKFDPERIGENTHNVGIYGRGFYTSRNKGTAKEYTYAFGDYGAVVRRGRNMGLFLNIQNPFRFDSIKSQEDFKAFLKQIGLKDFIIDFAPAFGLGLIQGDWRREAFSRRLKELGYDGIFAPSEEIAFFDSNQAKSATDNTGVFSARSDVRYSVTPIGAGLANESIFAGLLAADYVSGKDRGDETYERLRRALHVEDAGTLAEARAYAREMAEVRRYGLAGRAEASVRDAAAQGGQGADAIFGDAPSPDWTAEDYARHYEQFAAARALADAALGGMQEGVHLGAAARKAIDQARRNLIREAQGIDYEETVRHGGIDIAATLLGIDPDKFGALRRRKEEEEEDADAEPERPGPGEPGGRPLTEEEAGQVEAEQLALDERAKKLLNLFRGWKAERESERRKKERQRAEEERRRAQRAATDPDAGKKQAKADEDIDEEDAPDFTLFSVPLRLLKLCNIDVNNATEMAAVLRILVADYLVSRDATLTHETVFKRRPDNVSIYRKTMMRMMDELATKLVDPTKGALLRNIQKHIERIPEAAGVDTIERRTAAILRSIQMGAVRRTQGDLIRELQRDIHALGIKGRTLDKMERDAERKINGEREAMARYVNRIVAMGPRAVAAETDRLREIMDRRMADYSGADGRESAFGDVVRDAPVAPPGVKVESDVVYHDAAEKLRLLQEYGALRFALPAEIVEKGNKLRLWLEKGREEHLAKFETKAAENRAARDAIRAALASSGRSRRQRKGLFARFLEENGTVCFAQRVQILLADMPEGAAKREASRALTRCMRLIAEGSQERSVLMRRYAREFEGAVAAAIKGRSDADGNEWTVKSYLAHLDEKIPDSLSRYLTKQRNYDDGTRGGDARLTWGQALNLLGYLEQTATYAENIKRHGREGQAAAIRAAASEADLALLSQLRAVYAARRDALSVPVREISGFSVYNPDPLYMPANMFIPGSERDGLDTRVRGAWNPLAAPLTPRRANSRDVDESVSIADAYNRSSKATADAIAFGVRGIDLRSILASGPVKEAIREAEGPDFARAFNAHLTDILTGGDPGESGGTSMEMLRHVGTMASYSFLAWNPTSVLKQMTSIPAWAPLLPGGFRDVLRYMRDFDADSFRELCDAPGFVQRYGLDGIGVNRARAILADPTLNWAQKVAQCGMIGLQIGDSIPGFLVGTGLYKAKKQEYANAGESPELAAEHAARDTWALIEECQQSDLVQNLPELMRRHGVLGRSVLKFAASPLQQLSWEIHAWRVWKRTGNRDDLRRAIDATVANHVIMPALLWVVANAMGAALGDDPDDEDSWRLRELLVMSLLGSFGRVFFVGSLTDSGLRRLFGLRTYTNGAMPGTDMAAGLVRHGVGAARYLIEADYDRAVEELVKTVGSVAPPVKMAAKAVENWTD